MHHCIAIARRLFLSGPVLFRLALIALAAMFVSQVVIPAARAAASDTRDDGERTQEVLSAVRIWPAPEYTRVTIESRVPIPHRVELVGDPTRLVVDLERLDHGRLQRELAGKLAPGDPFVSGLRTGQLKPGVVRLVLDLRTAVKPQVFVLQPVGDYGFRLVIDLYPAEAVDPLMALVRRSESAVPGQAAAQGEAGSPVRTPETLRETPSERDAVISADQAVTAGSTSGRKGARAVDRLVTIALDPGHGGEDPGALGRRGSHEKAVTLTIAQRLKHIIDRQPGMRAVLTRDADYFVPLQARVDKARRVNADLFVSIHADAWIKPDARGSSVFALSERGATSAAARWLARRENEADLLGGVNIAVQDRHLARTLLDLSQTATIQDSLKLGRAVLTELADVNTLHRGRVEQAGFAVLKAPDIPSILVETAFISNPEEERRLNDERYQERVAQALLRGIQNYLAKNPPVRRPVVASRDTGRITAGRPLAASISARTALD